MKELKYFAIGSLEIVIIFILTVMAYSLKVFEHLIKSRKQIKNPIWTKKNSELPTSKAVIKSFSTVLTPISEEHVALYSLTFVFVPKISKSTSG
ncbi:hypothetical protein [Flagellimonas beolgyonensis]|uniref:hypothetical protein n=1 Tax=Flagellimonas beolgyonensis TaxID=864064 RepID=UPI003D655F32